MQWLSTRVGFGLVCALYVLSFPYHPGLRSPNELCRLWQSRALADHGTLNINATLQEAGNVGDLSCVLVVDVNGHRELHRCIGEPPPGPVVERWMYPSKAPLTSFLAAPVYWVLKRGSSVVSDVTQVFWSRLFVTILPTLAMLWLLRQFLRAYMSEAIADLMVITYALGTMAFSYSEAFMSHQLTAVLLFCTFFAGWKAERGELPKWGWLLAGVAAGAVVVSEYTGALGVVCVASYFVAKLWKRWRELGVAVALVVVGALPLLAALMAYHHACFGSPFTSGYKFLNDAGYQPWHLGGFLGIKVPDPRAFALSFFSPLRGFFALSPFLLIAFAGLASLRTSHRGYLIFLLVLLGAHTYFTSSFPYDSWGWTVGPRHLTALLPFMMVPVGVALDEWKKRQNVLWASLAAGLCVSSVLATGLVSFVNYVPDSISTSLFGLALPLLGQGVYPVSVLAAFVPNPTSGLVLVALLALVTLWLAMKFKSLGAAPLVLLGAIAVHFAVLQVATGDDHDGANKGAQGFLKSIWLAPNGSTVPIFGPPRSTP